MKNLFVYLEIEDNKVAEVSQELLTKGRSLANELGCQLEAVAIGYKLSNIAHEVIPYGVDVLHLFDDEKLSPYTTMPHASILVNLFKEEQPQICLMGATDLLYQIRPAFGGNIVATIVNPENRPQMATVREGVMKKAILDEDYKGEVKEHIAKDYFTDDDLAVEILCRQVEKAANNLKAAPIIVAGGYGVGSKDNFELIEELAHCINAEVGASRAAVDAGFIEHDRKIGQTGITVRPKLYIACGISGQIQHLAGMQDSSIVITINNDPEAPINAIADYVITGTIESVIPKMIAFYKQNSK